MLVIQLTHQQLGTISMFSNYLEQTPVVRRDRAFTLITDQIQDVQDFVDMQSVPRDRDDTQRIRHPARVESAATAGLAIRVLSPTEPQRP